MIIQADEGMGIYFKAVGFAMAAHHGQIRKYTGEPYYTHPVAVSEILYSHHLQSTPEMLAAAALHDVVEDTKYTLDDIRAYFGGTVARHVFWLTDISKQKNIQGNRAVRKAIDRDHIHKAPAEEQFIKLADLMHNTSSIVQHDKSFAKVYLREKALILDGLRSEVRESAIFKAADNQINEAMIQVML